MKNVDLKNETPTFGNVLLGVVYLVNRVDTGEYSFTTIEMAFNTKDKAETHKKILDEKYKDSISFQYRHFYFEVEELSVY